MTTLLMTATTAAILALLALPASAATLVNADPTARTIEIVEGGNQRRNETIPPKEKLEKLCPDGCIISIKDVADATFVLEGDEMVTIEGGLLYYDGPLEPVNAPEAKAETEPAQ